MRCLHSQEQTGFQVYPITLHTAALERKCSGAQTQHQLYNSLCYKAKMQEGKKPCVFTLTDLLDLIQGNE